MALTKTCADCGKEFTLSDIDLAHYKKFGLEPLGSCMQCMHMRRIAFRNERAFYRRKCDATGEDILSIYHPNSPYTVYKADYFWSDKWNPLDYGREFDFNRPFFEQFAELKSQVPRIAIHNARAENSEYCNTSYGNKDSYLIFGGDYNDHCMFGILCDKNKFCVDIDYCYRSELLYFCSDVVESYGSHFLFNSSHCPSCYFCDDCVGCDECILSFNLKNQSYCVENKKYPKEEYFERKKNLITGKASDQKRLFEKFLQMRAEKISKYAHIINCENCTGDYLKNSKNCTNCFDMSDSEDCREIIYGSKIKDCFASSHLGLGCGLNFNMQSVLDSYNAWCSFWIGYCTDVAYCDFCNNCRDLFGCVSLNHNRFCILNKQYSETDYKALRQKIVEHMTRLRPAKAGYGGQGCEWGKFFPAKLSCFGYNETTAHLYWPLTREEALKRGFNWRDKEGKTPVPQTYEVPDDIRDVKEDILQAVLSCEVCGKNFRIIEQELQWLKNNLVPVPAACWECRLDIRAKMRNPRKLWLRQCVKCSAELQSSYAPNRPEKILCEKCYLETVY